jgi:hypothetical protein
MSGGIRSMEIWREGAREGGMGWDGGQRKEREQNVERWRVREATRWLSTAPDLESPRGTPCCRSSAARVARGVSGDTCRRCKSGPRNFDVFIFCPTKIHESHE